MRFLIINGPNLNLLGKREPDIYGKDGYEVLCQRLKAYAAAHASTAECFQTNHEGAIIDAIHAADGVYDAIVLNPGAYTHYSIAILDALKAVDVPCVRSTFPTFTSGRNSATKASPPLPVWARSAAWAYTVTRRPWGTFWRERNRFPPCRLLAGREIFL